MMMKKMQKGFTLIELMIVVAIIGILAAIAIPNFIKFQARSKQAESKANLKAIYTAQKAYYQEKDSYDERVGQIGFTPERNNRYTYRLGATDAALVDRTNAADGAVTGGVIGVASNGYNADAFKGYIVVTHAPVLTGVQTGSTGGFFWASAAGNIDNAGTATTDYDQWSIGSESRDSGTASSRTACQSGRAAAGESCNDVNDV